MVLVCELHGYKIEITLCFDYFFRDPNLLKRIGAATALEVRATGIPYAFAPCIAVCTMKLTVQF